VQVVSHVGEDLKLEFPLPTMSAVVTCRKLTAGGAYICPTMSSLSSLSWPARTSILAHLAPKNRELKPAYHSTRSARVPDLSPLWRKGGHTFPVWFCGQQVCTPDLPRILPGVDDGRVGLQVAWYRDSGAFGISY
jgi:hypothetical protein